MATTTGGQTLNDRLNAARYALAGQGLARVVCKATTEELLAPKKKHLDYLLQCTYEANVSIPQMANLLIERTGHNSWIVVFKALITVHHLMCYGNERFTQYLASSNCSFQLSNFLDKTGVKGYDMSTYIRRYAKYLNEKALSYRSVALDFAKMKRGKEEGSLRTMTNDKLLKTLPILQNQVDALLEFDCTAIDLSNHVINAAFMLLFRDLIRLFACYNDGIINLLEKYFEMQRKQCREALDIYKKFLIRMDKVAEFLKVAENIGIDKVDIPDLTKAPSSLLEALEAHLNSLEAKGKRHKEKHGKGQTTESKPTAVTGDDQLKKALEEEAAAMNQLKLDKLLDIGEDDEFLIQEKHVKDKPFNPFLDTTPDLATFDTSASTTNSSSKSSSNDIIDLFGSNGTSSQPSNNLLTNQTSNLLFSSNQNGALHTQLNLNTLNASAGLLENGSNPISSSSNLGFKSNSDLLGVLANNSQSFHSNIFSQNHNIASLNPYQQIQLNFNMNCTPNQLAASNFSPASTSSFNPLQLQNTSPINSMQSNNQTTSPMTNTLQNYQSMQQNITMKNSLNINGNNLLMNPAFNTAASSNPFASGFAQPANTGGSSGTTSNTNQFEPNFANAFGSSSNPSNGSASRKPKPVKPAPPPSRPPLPSETKADDKVESQKADFNPFLASETLPASGQDNPFLNFDQSAVEEDEKLDSNNNEKINELSDKLETGLTVKDTSPLPDCPPSSPFTGDVSGNTETVATAIDKLNSDYSE